jgi:ribosomal protein L37AE/L43A
MPDFPRSLVEFQSRFPDEGACVAYLFAARWPHGFVCPACVSNKAWRLQTKAWTWECADCSKQFWAAYLMATHSNGIFGAATCKLLKTGGLSLIKLGGNPYPLSRQIY